MKKKPFVHGVCVIQAFNDWLIIHQQQQLAEEERERKTLVRVADPLLWLINHRS